MAAFSCRGLSVVFEGREAVSGVEFDLPAGAFLAVIGDNGSGKSTLLRTMCGLVKPASGAAELGDGLHRRDIGYVPQLCAPKRDFPASVFEVVISGRVGGLGWRPFFRAADREAAVRSLVCMGIQDLRKNAFRDLSGGQQQRVLIARALCAARKALLMDEPASALDAEAADNFYALLTRLRTERELTVVMVTHDRKRALTEATHILMLGERQEFFGTAEDFRKSRAAAEPACEEGER